MTTTEFLYEQNIQHPCVFKHMLAREQVNQEQPSDTLPGKYDLLHR